MIPINQKARVDPDSILHVIQNAEAMLTNINEPFTDITESYLLPRLVRLEDNLYGAAFTLMKIVPARFILRTAVNTGELDIDTLIVETTSGTFGLALAMEAALLRRNLVLVGDPAIDANLHRRLTGLGARVEICPEPAEVGGFQEARLRRVAEIRQRYPNSFCPQQYSNLDNGLSYRIVAEHIERNLGQIDCLVGPVGSGGSMCGTVTELRRRGDVRAIGIDTHHSVLFGQSDGHRMLRGLGNSLLPGNLDHSIFDEVHWCSASDAFGSTRRLHREHALFQGPTSGAAFQVARWWAARNPDALCVAFLPDEGYRYQDTAYNESWLEHQNLTAEVAEEPIEISDPRDSAGGWERFAWGRRKLADVRGQADD